VVLQANNDITESAGATINATGNGNLTLQAGRSVVLDGTINIRGSLDITANDPNALQQYRSAGAAVLDTSLAALTASKVNLTNSGGDILSGAVTARTGGVNLTASNNILLTANKALKSLMAASISLISDSDGTGGGGIYLDTGSSINSNGGNIVMSGATSRAIGNGTITGGITFDSGIYVLGNITAGAGNVTMRGEGANNNFADGITFAGGTLSSNGIVTIDGIAHGYSSNSGAPSYMPTGPNWFAAGVDFLNAGTRLTTQTGTVTVTGLNTAPNMDPYFFRADGIMVETGTIVETTGKGTLTFNGTANSFNTSWGVGVIGTIRTTAAGGGAITLNGVQNGGDGGVVISGGGVISNGGSILMEGSSPAGGDSIGIDIGSTIGGANAGNITLVAHEKFTNVNSGNPITTAGRLLIYSVDPALNNMGGIAENFHRYNCTYLLGAPNCLTAGTVIPATGNGFFYSIAPVLTVTANAATKTYGTADASVLTYSAAGYLAGDSAANAPMSGSLAHTGGENVGTGYTITQGSLLNQMGYGITFTGNTLIITPALLTVTANATSKVLNTADPLLTYSVSGLQFTDKAANTLTGSLTRVPGETVGTYQINQGTVALALTSPGTNYTMIYVPGNFNILVPTVINEIVDISNQRRKTPPEEVLAVNIPTGDSGNTQSLPMCN
jgi:hypothetical protein